MDRWSPAGISGVPHIQWGSHVAHFFGAGNELSDVLVPYFKAGLENNERCLWVTGRVFNAEEARSALGEAVLDLDQRIQNKQIDIANAEEWYRADDKVRSHELVRELIKHEQESVKAGYAGLRTNGNCAWVSGDQWADFLEYESLVQQAVRGRRMICMCSYCVNDLGAHAYADIMERHDLVLPSAGRSSPRMRHDTGDFARQPFTEKMGVAELRQALEDQKRTFDLAMTASDMGTWRYTLADNVCVYDENAQRLYGLSEARFLHDAQGVKAKFHIDDLEPMWAQVAKALDPRGDGQYDAEYRVKQFDGSWRWVSAWGIVEFEGEGPGRMPVAIVGASRDLTKLKQSEELQRLLLNELNHRVKNTLATIQAITAQTLRAARDLPSAREALDRRIRSLAQAHDLLTVRAWSSANLTDVVIRALDAFAPTQVTISGTAVDVSPKHALSLSLALHELATNAAKYGALSCPDGRVSVQWGIEEGMLQLHWEETGGPPVAPPSKRGFGSRLLEDIVIRDLNGDTRLSFESSGVRCSISAAL